MRELSRNSSGKIEIVSERYQKSSGVSGKSRGTLKAPERSRKLPECSRTFWNVPECLVDCPLGSAQEGAAAWARWRRPKKGHPLGVGAKKERKEGGRYYSHGTVHVLFTYVDSAPSPLLGVAGPRGGKP